MSTKAFRLTVLLFVLLLAIVVLLHAASNGSISIDTDNTPTGKPPAIATRLRLVTTSL